MKYSIQYLYMFTIATANNVCTSMEHYLTMRYLQIYLALQWNVHVNISPTRSVCITTLEAGSSGGGGGYWYNLYHQ